MTTEIEDLSRYLPLRPRDYLILFSVVSEARHGYGIIRQVEKETEGATRLDPANLYRAVKRLAAEGLIEEVEDIGDEDGSGERKRFWKVTSLGQRVVVAEATRLAHLASLARSSGLIPHLRG